MIGAEPGQNGEKSGSEAVKPAAEKPGPSTKELAPAAISTNDKAILVALLGEKATEDLLALDQAIQEAKGQQRAPKKGMNVDLVGVADRTKRLSVHQVSNSAQRSGSPFFPISTNNVNRRSVEFSPRVSKRRPKMAA